MAIGARNILGGVLAVLMMSVLIYLVFQPKTFDVVVLNSSGNHVCDVGVSFEGFPRFFFGDLMPSESIRGQSRFLMHRGPWPSEVLVEWGGCGSDEAFRVAIPVGAPLRFYSDEHLQLVVEFNGGEVDAYPRVVESLEKGLRFRYSN